MHESTCHWLKKVPPRPPRIHVSVEAQKVTFSENGVLMDIRKRRPRCVGDDEHDDGRHYRTWRGGREREETGCEDWTEMEGCCPDPGDSQVCKLLDCPLGPGAHAKTLVLDFWPREPRENEFLLVQALRL